MYIYHFNDGVDMYIHNTRTRADALEWNDRQYWLPISRTEVNKARSYSRIRITNAIMKHQKTFACLLMFCFFLNQFGKLNPILRNLCLFVNIKKLLLHYHLN